MLTINLSKNNALTSNVEIELYDIQGRIIDRKTVNTNNNSVTLTDLNSLTKGIYFITLKNTKGTLASNKFIKN